MFAIFLIYIYFYLPLILKFTWPLIFPSFLHSSLYFPHIPFLLFHCVSKAKSIIIYLHISHIIPLISRIFHIIYVSFTICLCHLFLAHFHSFQIIPHLHYSLRSCGTCEEICGKYRNMRKNVEFRDYPGKKIIGDIRTRTCPIQQISRKKIWNIIFFFGLANQFFSHFFISPSYFFNISS